MKEIRSLNIGDYFKIISLTNPHIYKLLKKGQNHIESRRSKKPLVIKNDEIIVQLTDKSKRKFILDPTYIVYQIFPCKECLDKMYSDGLHPILDKCECWMPEDKT